MSALTPSFCAWLCRCWLPRQIKELTMTRSSSGPNRKRSVRDRPAARLTIVRHQNTAKKSNRLIACPYCDSIEVRPSHLMNLVDNALRFLFISRYRCKDCRHRFWKINYSIQARISNVGFARLWSVGNGSCAVTRRYSSPHASLRGRR